MPLTSRVTVGYSSNLSATVELAALTALVGESRSFAFINGVLEDACDKAWYDQGSLGDGASVTIDLQNLLDSFGSALSFAKIRALIVENTSATQVLSVGAAGTNAFSAFMGDSSDTVIVDPMSPLVVMSRKTGFTVDATHKNLKIANSGGAVCSYNVWIIGTSS